MTRLFLMVLLAAGPGTPPPASFGDMTEPEIDQFLQALQRDEKDLAARLERVSERFLGVPYGDSPLGEGEGHPPDPDPLIRFDRVDCTTFLEQTLALAQASNLKEALDLLTRIRYQDGEIGYARRKHFMMAQWIPQNQREGWLLDITETVGGDSVRWATKTLDERAWSLRRRKERYPRLEPDQIPLGEHRLPIIPVDRTRELAAHIPAGVILNVVRRDFRSIPVRVSHQGLVIVRRGKRYLRHAARAGYGRVVDELLDTFLSRNQAYRKWPVEGINLQRVTDPSCSQK